MSGEMGVRRFGRVNWMGLRTLAARETKRFMAVWTQTIAAPLVTAALFLGVFTLAIGPQRGDVMGVPFIEFLAPGILMMTVIQNAFANTSSSIMVAKVQGNIVDTLMPPLSAGELVAGYLAGGMVRGMMVAVAIAAAMVLGLGSTIAHPLWALVFVLLGSVFLGSLGIIGAIFASKFDQMAAITNFVITPLAFLSGTFYSIERLPEGLQALIHVNPVFYLIDGVRYGFIGTSDSPPERGLAICLLACAVVVAICWRMFKTGYRLKA